jgi:general secretion pathway protein A
MSYYKILGYDKEPFSTSPDPDFLFLSREVDLVLTNLLIELRLKRGLNVILGDIGTGKTTLSRKLVKELSSREAFLFHIILNPTFSSEKDFIVSLVKNFVPTEFYPGDISAIPVSEMRDIFEKFLLHQVLSNNKIVVLIIDEAQKISLDTLEALRVLLNYETNTFKLIQLILLGQLELHAKLLQMQNFYDRIDFKFTLNPLGFDETKSMIQYRIVQGGYKGQQQIFTDEAIKEIHGYAKGYPRVIIRICHICLRKLIVNKASTRVDKEIALIVIKEDSAYRWQKTQIPQNANF